MKQKRKNKKKRPTFIFLCPSFIKQTNETQPTKRIEREKNRTIDEVETRRKKNWREKKTHRIVIYPTPKSRHDCASPFLSSVTILYVF